jgi:hypothetical protein
MVHRFEPGRSLTRLAGADSENAAASTQNGSVKQFVAADLATFTSEISGRDRQLSKAVLSSDTRLGESSSGLNQNNDSNLVCEAIRADAFVKHESAWTATN